MSTERIRGIRLFDISDLDHPKYITNVQTCRGSHTHSLLVDPKDQQNVYVYISGSSLLRSPKELAGMHQRRPPETTRVRRSCGSRSSRFRSRIRRRPPSSARLGSSTTSKRRRRHGETAADSAEFSRGSARAETMSCTIFGNEADRAERDDRDRCSTAS